LFINAQHHRLVWRIEIEPDDVDHLLSKLGIVRQFERARQMRLEAVFFPHPLYRRVADAELLRQQARAPVRGVLWLLLGRAHHDLEPHLVTDALLAGKRALALILEQPIYPAIQVGLLPAPHSRLGDARLSLDRARAEALSRQQHDAGTLDDLLRRL